MQFCRFKLAISMKKIQISERKDLIHSHYTLTILILMILKITTFQKQELMIFQFKLKE